MESKEFYISPKLDVVEVQFDGIVCTSGEVSGTGLTDYSLQEELTW